MTFGLGARLIADCPLPDYLREAVMHFKAIELNVDPRYFSPYFALTAPQKKILRIYRERYQFKLTMHAPFVSVRLGALDREARQIALNIIINTMQAATDLGVTLITFHPCTLEPQAPEQYKENCLLEEGSISLLLQKAKQLGVSLLMENMPHTPEFHPGTSDGSRFQELLWLFTEPEFGLTIDIGHALQAGVSVEALLKMDRVRHFHLHENDRCRDLHQPIREHLEQWESIMKLLIKKYPHAVGILELKRYEDQLESLHNLNQLLPKRNRTIRQKGQAIIPPLLG